MQPLNPAHTFTTEGCTTNIYHGDVGQGLPKHDHIYSHVTYVASGSVVIRKEFVEKIVTKYTQPINLKAGEWHEFEVLEKDTVFVNVFSDSLA